MRNVYADLHIHVGSAGGRAVKITASRKMDLHSVLYEAAPRKGLDMVGIVDAGSILVSTEIEAMLKTGELREHPEWHDSPQWGAVNSCLRGGKPGRGTPDYLPAPFRKHKSLPEVYA